MQRLIGIGVSPGIASGPAVLLVQSTRLIRRAISSDRVEQEAARFHEARERSRRQLESIKARIGRAAGLDLAALFDAQLLMLDDPMLLIRAEATIRERRVNAEWALQEALEELSAVLDDVEDPYLRERKGDLADVVGRLRMNLRHGSAGPRDLLKGIDEACVLIADELTPSLVAQLDWTQIRGFATDAGARTSHTSILARSLQVPAVVGLRDATTRIQAGSLVVIDANANQVVVDPPASVVRELAGRSAGAPRVRAPRIESTPSITLDGVRIRLEANIELPDDLVLAKDLGAEGIGLYRSEFLLASHPAESVTEEIQYHVYRQMLEEMAPRPVTVRTFDVDEDQLAGRSRRPDLATEWPALAEHSRGRLGLRAVRLSSGRRELLRRQLRALLRAASHGRLRIMFPFVSGLEEFREAKAVLAEATSELERRGEAAARVPVGVMVEVPSAAFTADLLAREVDFLTIGTNDLIQCCLAVDRTDERVSHLYEPLHPAILRLIRHVRKASARQKVPLSLCGEMALDPAMLALLVGFGLTEFSMAPGAIPLARQVIERAHAGELRRVAAATLRLASVAEIEEYLLTALREAGAQKV